MHVLLLILALLFSVAAFVSAIFIIVDAFQYDPWAGIFCIVFLPYMIYYAIFEYEHERKWWILAGFLGATFLSALFFEIAMGVPVVKNRTFL